MVPGKDHIQVREAVPVPPSSHPQTGFLCVALVVLELTLYAKLSSNSEICLPLPPSAGIKGSSPLLG